MASSSRNLILSDDEWEFELDTMGPFASKDRLMRHLDAAPEGNLVAEYLRGYLLADVTFLPPPNWANRIAA